MDEMMTSMTCPVEKGKLRPLFCNLKEILALNLEFLSRLTVRLFGERSTPTSS
ncbi:hypothetical protein HMI55_003013, partial [Coelomomyces lativittatus]